MLLAASFGPAGFRVKGVGFLSVELSVESAGARYLRKKLNTHTHTHVYTYICVASSFDHTCHILRPHAVEDFINFVLKCFAS